MKNVNRFLIITMLLVLGGCASVPMADMAQDTEAKQFKSPGEGKAGLYIFRDSFVGTALKKTIRVNDKIVGESAPDVFFYTIVDAGKHVISTESEFSPNDLVIKTESNKNYFVENYITIGLFTGGANLRQVSESEGMNRVHKLRLAK